MMENLQNLEPIFQKLMEDWYQLTLHNQEYAICLAISVWLLTAIFYSIRIGFLKKRNTQLVTAYQTVQTKLTEAETQLQALQQQLTEAGEKLQQSEQQTEAEIQRAAGIEQRLNRSNQQLVSSLSNLVGCFELNIDKLPNAESDNLLTEFSAVISRVAERFQNEQQAKTQLQLTMHAEAEKMAEKDAMVESLQSRLDTQTQQLAKFEMAIEKFEAAERQMELDQQQFALERQQRQTEASRLAELEKQVLAHAQAKPIETVVEKVAPVSASAFAAQPIESVDKLVEKSVIEPAKMAKPVPTESVVAVKTKPEPNKIKPTESNKGKGFFGRAMEKFSKFDEKLGMQPAVNSAADQLEDLTEELPVAEVKAAVEDVVETAKAEVAQKSAGLNQKISGLFGGMKKTSAKTQPEATATVETIVEAVTETLPESAAAGADKAASKLSSMFGSFKRRK
jgi:F0F1-type ATP synthase membrane subunit b/b'